MGTMGVKHGSSRGAAGLTLVEMLIVLVVVGMMLSMALPQIVTVRQRMQLDAAAQQLVGDLRLAQVEALKRNRSIPVRRTGGSSYNIEFVGDRVLDGGVTFASGPDSIAFASFGPPVSGASSFVLQLGSRQKGVAVNAAGLLSVQ